MVDNEILSEFEAAQLLKISPLLLRWFTSYSAKKDDVKLGFENRGGIYYYDSKDLNQ